MSFLNQSKYELLWTLMQLKTTVTCYVLFHQSIEIVYWANLDLGKNRLHLICRRIIAITFLHLPLIAHARYIKIPWLSGYKWKFANIPSSDTFHKRHDTKKTKTKY